MSHIQTAHAMYIIEKIDFKRIIYLITCVRAIENERDKKSFSSKLFTLGEWKKLVHPLCHLPHTTSPSSSMNVVVFKYTFTISLSRARGFFYLLTLILSMCRLSILYSILLLLFPRVLDSYNHISKWQRSRNVKSLKQMLKLPLSCVRTPKLRR